MLKNFRKFILLFIFILLIIIFFKINKKENFSTSLGNIKTSKIIFQNKNKHSTDIINLEGNMDDTIIFIHNTPFNMQIWMPLFNYIFLNTSNSKLPNLLAYDMIGHSTGWVNVPSQFNDLNPNNKAWEMTEFVSDLKEIYEKFVKKGKIKLVGYGTGGKVAQSFALTYPDLIKSLYIMNISISPIKMGIEMENQYLINWIRNNPNVSYLTMEETFIQYNLCLWFNNNKSVCQKISKDDNSPNQIYEDNSSFLLSQNLYRTFNCATYLQMNKLVENLNLQNKWINTKVDFPVNFLISDNDHYTNILNVKNDLETINTINDLNLTIVKGTHIFPLTNPDFLFEWIINDKNMLENSSTLNFFKY